MNNSKSPKWEIGKTIYAGNQTFALANKYKSDIEGRLKPGEIEELGNKVSELERKRAGQSESLTSQKSRTHDQDSTVDALHLDVIDIHNSVKAVTDNAGILKAFGIGENTYKTVSSITAAGNMVFKGYAEHKEWTNNEAGILDEDMEIIQADVLALNKADNVQEKSKFQRKASTMDKNTLQRSFEDLITKISVIDIRIFRRKDPAVVPLFEGLIP